ncbi:MAG: GNAT family N-acetyltransferase [Pseudomonadota bacterium]
MRPAQASDAASIAAISIEVWLGTYLRNGVNAVFADYALQTFSRAKTEALIADGHEFIIVSEDKDGIVGFVRLSTRRAAPGDADIDVEISTLYVQPRHHGKGIGRRLLHAAFEQCRAIGAEAVWLATNAENTPAIEFYLAQGFEHIGETQFRIGDQAFPNNVYAYRLNRTTFSRKTPL